MSWRSLLTKGDKHPARDGARMLMIAGESSATLRVLRQPMARQSAALLARTRQILHKAAIKTHSTEFTSARQVGRTAEPTLSPMSNLPVSLIRSGITAASTDDPPALVSSSGGSPDCCPSSADPRRNFCFKIAQGGTAWIVFRITSRLRVLIVNRTGAAPASRSPTFVV